MVYRFNCEQSEAEGYLFRPLTNQSACGPKSQYFIWCRPFRKRDSFVPETIHLEIRKRTRTTSGKYFCGIVHGTLVDSDKKCPRNSDYVMIFLKIKMRFKIVDEKIAFVFLLLSFLSFLSFFFFFLRN